MVGQVLLESGFWLMLCGHWHGCGCSLLCHAAVVRGENFSEENVNQAPLLLQLGCKEIAEETSEARGVTCPSHPVQGIRGWALPPLPLPLQAWVGPGGRRALKGLLGQHSRRRLPIPGSMLGEGLGGWGQRAKGGVAGGIITHL